MTPLAVDAVSASGVGVSVGKTVDVGASVGEGVVVGVMVDDACAVGKAGVGRDAPQPVIRTVTKTNTMTRLWFLALLFSIH